MLITITDHIAAQFAPFAHWLLAAPVLAFIACLVWPWVRCGWMLPRRRHSNDLDACD